MVPRKVSRTAWLDKVIPPHQGDARGGPQGRATDRAQPARGLAAGSGGLGCTQASTRASGRASNSLQT